MQGEHSVQFGANELSSWEVVDDDGEFVRLNLNGGDSAAYWHYKEDFELSQLQGRRLAKLKEVLPEYYRELIEKKKQKDKELKAQKSKANASHLRRR